METNRDAGWSLNGMDFFPKNRYKMCLNLIPERFPQDEFSVNIPEQVFAADGRKGGFIDFQPKWFVSDNQLCFKWDQPGKAAISVELAPSPLVLGYSITVRNLDEKAWENVCAFPCFNQIDAPAFEDRVGHAKSSKLPRDAAARDSDRHAIHPRCSGVPAWTLNGR